MYLIYRNWDEVKPRLLGAFELIRSAAIKLWETMRPFIEPIINAWKSIFDFIIGLIRQVASFLHLDWLVGGIDKALVHAYTDSVAHTQMRVTTVARAGLTFVPPSRSPSCSKAM